MLRSLLIAIAAALLVGAAVTNRAEAQGSWTCNLDFTQGIPSGWTNNAADPFTVTASGLFKNGGYGVLDWTGSGATFTSVSMTVSAAGSSTFRHVASTPSPYYINANNTWLAAGTQTFSASGFSASSLGFAYNPGNTSGYLISAVLTGTGTQPAGCAATPTPTNTAVPTNTPIPSATPPPTSTPVAYPTDAPYAGAAGDSYWGNTYNFAIVCANLPGTFPGGCDRGMQGWSLITGSKTDTGIVSARLSGLETIELSYPLTNVRLTDVFVNYWASCPNTFEVKDGDTVFEAGSVGNGNQAIVWQGSHVMANGTLKIRIVESPGCTASPVLPFTLTEITLMGYGANPTNLQATAVAIQTGGIYSGLSDVNELLESLPSSISAGAPNETGRQLFGYAKWLISPSSADELAGPFAPIVSHTGIFVSLTFVLILIYAVVWALVFIFRFVAWLVRWIFRIIDLVLQIAQVVAGAVGNVIGTLFKFI